MRLRIRAFRDRQRLPCGPSRPATRFVHFFMLVLRGIGDQSSRIEVRHGPIDATACVPYLPERIGRRDGIGQFFTERFRRRSRRSIPRFPKCPRPGPLQARP